VERMQTWCLKRRIWRKIHIHCPAGEWFIRREGGSTSKCCKCGRSRSPPAMLVIHRCCPSCLTKSRPIRISAVSRRTVPMTPVNVMRRLQRAMPMLSSRRVRTHTPEKANQCRSYLSKRSSAHITIPGPGALATADRIPPPKSRRNQDALQETARAKPPGAD